MAVMREWACLEHGPFERTHPICPAYGCDSRAITQEFRTPVTIGSQFRKRHEAGMRKSADMYQVSDWKSSKAGDVSFAGRSDPSLGSKVLWGDESKRVLGHSFSELTQIAAKPLVGREGQVIMSRNNGMAEAATAAGITSRRLPRADEVSVSRAEKGADVAKALTV